MAENDHMDELKRPVWDLGREKAHSLNPQRPLIFVLLLQHFLKNKATSGFLRLSQACTWGLGGFLSLPHLSLATPMNITYVD